MPKCKYIPELTPKQLQRFWDKVDMVGRENHCREWTGSLDPAGYGQVCLNRKVYKAHRVAYKLAKGDPGDLYVCHSCDNPKCCNPKHLWLGTPQDNSNDCVAKGRQLGCTPAGERCHLHVLTEVQVANIKAYLKYRPYFGLQARLAKKYGVTQGAIARIKTNTTWKHVRARFTDRRVIFDG